MKIASKYFSGGIAIPLALFLQSCLDFSSNDKAMVTTHSYGVDLSTIPDFDSVTVDIVWDGDIKQHYVYSESDVESDHKIRWDIVAPETEEVSVHSIVWWGGDSVYAQHGIYTSGQTPNIPDPVIASPAGTIDSFTDGRDGETYKYRRIGTQIWMLQNLNYSGDDGEGGRIYTKGWCYGVGGSDTTVHNNSNTCNTYGRLYTWADAMDIDEKFLLESWDNEPSSNHRGICPLGWHVPAKAEWNELSEFIDLTNDGNDDGNEGTSLKSNSNLWTSGRGTDEFLFSGLPASFRDTLGTWDYPLGSFAEFITATEHYGTLFKSVSLGDISSELFQGFDYKYGGFSLRCVKNKESEDDFSSSVSSSRQSSLAQSSSRQSSARQSSVSYSSVSPSSSALSSSIPSNSSSSSLLASSSSSSEFSWEECETENLCGSFTDERDNQTYKYVVIGTQTWMAQNLNYATSTSLSSCYGDILANCQIYGRLYDWASVMGELPSANSSIYSDTTSHQGICPTGWHVPMNSEWQILERFMNNSNGDADDDGDLSDDDVGVSIKASNGWSDDGSGTDMFGFSAQPGGQFETAYELIGYIGVWWTATGFSETEGYARLLGYAYPDLRAGNISKENRMSLRCLKNDEAQ